VKNHPAIKLGFWSSCFVALLGIVYISVLIFNFVSQGMAFPPPPSVQLAGGIITLITASSLVVLYTAIHYAHAEGRSVYGALRVSFILLFAISVSINRFVQLTVIQQAGIQAASTDLKRFLPHDTGSVMFSLEMPEWGFFSSLAALAVAPLFVNSRLALSIRWLFVTYALLSFISVISYATQSPLTISGFVTWGPVLTAITVLLAIYFKQSSGQVLEQPYWVRFHSL
jgi:hypothetical protein